jgi:hypothetical protein
LIWHVIFASRTTQARFIADTAFRRRICCGGPASAFARQSRIARRRNTDGTDLADGVCNSPGPCTSRRAGQGRGSRPDSATDNNRTSTQGRTGGIGSSSNCPPLSVHDSARRSLAAGTFHGCSSGPFRIDASALGSLGAGVDTQDYPGF